MKWKYTIKEGSFYHKQFVWNSIRSLMCPVFNKNKSVSFLISKNYQENLTPIQTPPQINKLFGYALLGIPHWYSIRIGIASCDGYYDLFWYSYKNGVRSTSLISTHNTSVFFVKDFDLSQFRKSIPIYLRWLPMARLHSYFGGKLPSSRIITNVVYD